MSSVWRVPLAECEQDAKAAVGSPQRVRFCEAPLLTVIVPVFNESATIDQVLRRVLSAPYRKQVIVVDDGSSDGTAEVLEAWEGHPAVELLAHGRNRGKGAAIRTALENARGRFTIIQDADLEYDPQDYPDLIEPLLSGDAQVVYGSRTLNRHWAHGQRWNLFALGVRVLNVCLRLLYGARVTDEATCYKAFPTATLKAMALQCEGFEFCPEVTAKACRLGLKILEVPIHYEPRSVREGKKIRWSDGWKALLTLWRYRHWRCDLGRTIEPSGVALSCAAKENESSGGSEVERRLFRFGPVISEEAQPCFVRRGMP
ncbi:MAG: glycosyltransferase family 2 protein [Thermoguttaceae bacterium]